MAARSALGKLDSTSTNKRVKPISSATTPPSNSVVPSDDNSMAIDQPMQLPANKPLVPTQVQNDILKQFGLSDASASSPTAPENTAVNRAPINSPVDTNTPIDDKGKDKDTNPMTFAIPLATKYAAYTPADNLKGRSYREKVISAEEIFCSLNGFTGATARTHQKEKIVIAFFATPEDLQSALRVKCTIKVKPPQDQIAQNDHQSAPVSHTNDQTLPNQANTGEKVDKEFYFKDFATVKTVTRPTKEQKEESKPRTIQLIDIPLGISTMTIHKALSQYGEIDSLRLITVKLHQQAFVTFKSRDTVEKKFITPDTWSIVIMRMALRVLPLSLTTAQRELRRKYVLKLSGFSPDTSARDLLPFLTDVKAKTCFIPRNPTNYKQLKYAFVSFASAQDIKDALNRQASYNGSVLHWSLPSHTTCHVCGDPEHIAKDCKDPRNKRSKDYQRYQKLYNKFKPAQHRKPRSQNKRQRTTEPPNKTNRYWNKQNINPNNADNTQQSEFAQMLQAFKDLQRQINLFDFKLSSVSKDLETLKKQDNKNGNASINGQRQQQSQSSSNTPNNVPKRNYAQVASSPSSSETEHNTPSLNALDDQQKQLASSLSSITKHMDSFGQMLERMDKRQAEQFKQDHFIDEQYEEYYEEGEYSYEDINYEEDMLTESL